MVQNGNISSTPTIVTPYKSAQLDKYLTYCALSGHITDEIGSVHAMGVGDFCRAFNISSSSISRWRQMPDFGQRVTDRRLEIVPYARESAAWNRLYMLGIASKDHKAAVEALKLFLGHFSDLQLPVQRQDIKVEGGWAEILMSAKREGIIEGEIVDEPTVTTGSDSAPGALPQTS